MSLCDYLVLCEYVCVGVCVCVLFEWVVTFQVGMSESTSVCRSVNLSVCLSVFRGG